MTDINVVLNGSYKDGSGEIIRITERITEDSDKILFDMGYRFRDDFQGTYLQNGRCYHLGDLNKVDLLEPVPSEYVVSYIRISGSMSKPTRTLIVSANDPEDAAKIFLKTSPNCKIVKICELMDVTPEQYKE